MASGNARAGLLALALAAGAASLPAQTIDTIVVEPHNVFDDTGSAPGFLAHLGNALHVTTRPWVIRQTIFFNQGDPYDSARAVESERALRELFVFRSVRLDTTRVDGRLALRAVTSDGWSTKPQLGFGAAGGSTHWELGLNEDNFLGTATTIGAVYLVTPDRREVDLGYQRPSFLFRRATISATYRDKSDGTAGLWSYGVPFYQTSAPFSLITDGEAAKERVLIFRDGVQVATPQRRALRFTATGGVALHASTRGYSRLWLSGTWRREDFDSAAASPFPRSTFGTIGAGLNLGHSRFRIVEHLNSFARREDADLSETVGIGVWAAPRAFGYANGRDGVGLAGQAQGSAVWKGGFAVLRAAGDGVFGGSGLDSGRVTGSFTAAHFGLPRQTWIVHVEAGSLRGEKPGDEFDLWTSQNGPRLFGAHQFIGSRMLWAALENRVVVSDDFSGLLGVGLAPFLDYGGAWYGDERPREGGDVGLTLRLGPTQAIKGDVAEIAVGYRFGQGFTGSRWAVAVRRGIRY
ncbi:MAG TPA: hypothetical protein VFK78_03150 [Gemmatimonadales bacterium]|nr:hypothetical protein [Gemmatimonadales bacterium]